MIENHCGRRDQLQGRCRKPGPFPFGRHLNDRLAVFRMQDALAVGFEQRIERADLTPQFLADVGVRNQPSPVRRFKDIRGREDVAVFLYRVSNGGERPMRHQAHPPGVVNQRVACDAGRRLIGLAEAAVNREQPPARFDRAFAVLLLDRDVAIDDMAVPPAESEFRENPLDRLGVVVVLIIWVFGFFPGRFVGDEHPLKGRHPASAEDRRVLAAPQEPHEVLAIALLLAPRRGKITRADLLFAVIVERFAPIALSLKLKALEAPVLCQRDAAVEEKVPVAAKIQPADREQEPDVGLKLVASQERSLERGDQPFLFPGQAVWVFRVDGREIGVLQRVNRPAEIDRPRPIVDLVEQHPLIHVKLRMPRDDLPFKLLLDDRDRLSQLCDTLDVAQADGPRLQHLRRKRARVAIGFLREGGERPEADPIAVFQHIDVRVGKRHVQDVRDARLASSGRGHPEHIVVAPLDIHRMVPHQKIHDLIRARPAVENIPNHMEMIDRKALDEGGERDDKRIRAPHIDDR